MENPHISVCICTYRRPEWLARLLQSLSGQVTENLFTYSIVVADNDREEMARPVVEAFQKTSEIELVYRLQPISNIALTRNTAIEAARGDYIAFIDDDEFPIPEWLLYLYRTCENTKSSGVLGPVRPYFEEGAPEWAKKCGLYDREEYETGHVMPWRETRTGNVLFRRAIVEGRKEVFREKFGTGGEDQDFFRRMIEEGHRFVWCNEAIVHESVPAIRWDKKVLMKRALLRGKNTLRHSDRKSQGLLKSLLAVLAYTCSLPFLALAGKHLFMRYLIKLCDHLGKLLAFVRLNPIDERVG